MIEYKTGDLFKEDVDALVNSVNCVGVMGRGVALQFKRKFPENFKAYARACDRREVQPGRMFVFEMKRLGNPRYIINFPTKRHWRGKSRIEDIEAGLLALAQVIAERDIHSIAIPPLGSDLGGLEWSDVRPRIDAMLKSLDAVQAIVFEPGSGPADGRPNPSTDVPEMTPGRAALVGLIHTYLQGLLDPFVTLLEVHKLMYFMQVRGEPLRLRFQKHYYGPYAENLRHVLRAVDGHLITGYGDGGDAPDKRIELVPGAVNDAQAYLDDQLGTRSRFDEVTDLVGGFESAFGLELLATVHWVATENPRSSEDDIVSATYAWGERKDQFSDRQIRLALGVLRDKGWLDGPSASDA